MTTELRWISSLPASALHAAEALLTGHTLTDAKLAATLDTPTKCAKR